MCSVRINKTINNTTDNNRTITYRKRQNNNHTDNIGDKFNRRTDPARSWNILFRQKVHNNNIRKG